MLCCLVLCTSVSVNSTSVIYCDIYPMTDITAEKKHFIWQKTSSSVINTWQVLPLQSLK